MRKSLGINFAGESREEGVMFTVDCVVEGIKGDNVSIIPAVAPGGQLIGTVRISTSGETLPLLGASF